MVEKYTRFFFQVHRKKTKASQVTKLIDGYRQMQCHPKILNKLYKVRPSTPTTKKVKYQAIINIGDQVDVEKNTKLRRYVTLEELTIAIQKMYRDKSSSPD